MILGYSVEVLVHDWLSSYEEQFFTVKNICNGFIFPF
jgi:hypothetical protein